MNTTPRKITGHIILVVVVVLVILSALAICLGLGPGSPLSGLMTERPNATHLKKTAFIQLRKSCHGLS
jgi:hypothetical protein